MFPKFVSQEADLNLWLNEKRHFLSFCNVISTTEMLGENERTFQFREPLNRVICNLWGFYGQPNWV